MNTKTDGVSRGLVASIYLAFSEDGENIRFWTSNAFRAVEWAQENWETEAFVRLSDAEAIISDLQNLVTAENQRKLINQQAKRIKELEAATRAENEACAKVAEQMPPVRVTRWSGLEGCRPATRREIAEAIRARMKR